MIVDLKMPGISGLEFAGEASACVPNSRIIILTSYGDMKSAVEAMRIGAFRLSDTKPIDLDRLLQTLRKADERRRLILENRDLLRRLTEANRIKAEFINGMSHEVWTPLGHITGFTQILPDTSDILTKKQERYIGNILSFNTIKTGDVQVTLESVDLNEIFDTAIEEAMSTAADLVVTVEKGRRYSGNSAY